MKLTEKMAYLQGLIEGLDIDTSTKEGKILMQMSELMKEVVVYVDDLQSQVDELTELCDNLDEDLSELEREVYNIDDDDCCCDDDCDCDCDDDDCDCCCDDEESYEIECPNCGEIIEFDESVLEEGSLNCPNCNTELEFDDDELTIEDFENDETDS